MVSACSQSLSNPTPRHCPDGTRANEHGFRCGPLSSEERLVVYEYVNEWIYHRGLDGFVTKKWTKEECIWLVTIVNGVNAAKDAGAAPRSALELKRQIKKLYEGRLSPFKKLAKRSEELKMLIERGCAVSNKERFPEMAIPMPTTSNGVNITKDDEKKASNMGSKRYHEEVNDEKIFEPPPTKKQKKEVIVKLLVDLKRIEAQANGQMVVATRAEKDEIVTQDEAEEYPLEDETQAISTSGGE